MWALSSRIHKLNYFPNEGVSCYVKRDDELGCGISGSKVRKYASLMPILMQKNIRHLLIIAGSQSNNLLAALQMAREFKLQVTAFLIKPRNLKIQGNFRLSLLFLNDQEIIWVNREEWSKVETLAYEHMKYLKEPGFILIEGASVAEALDGAMSLASDIILNEYTIKCTFQHIFIDAGTGFSAAGLIKGLTLLNHQAIVHVLLLADDESTFQNKLENWLDPVSTKNYQCFYPTTARSFGSVNQKIKSEIKRLAREEGILADPIYSGKLFYESRLYISTHHIQGNVLIIHSGGALALANFAF